MKLSMLRNILLILMVGVLVYLWGQWDATHKKNANNISNSKNSASEKSNKNKASFGPPVSVSSKAKTATLSKKAAPPLNKKLSTDMGDFVNIKTNQVSAQISLLGGNLAGLDLLKYPISLQNKTPFALLDDNPFKLDYQAISGLLGDGIPNPIPFKTMQRSYQMQPGQKDLKVDFSWQNDKFKVIKTYIFNDSNYAVKVLYKVTNLTKNNLTTRLYGQFNQTEQLHKKGLLSSYTSFVGAVLSTKDNHYQKQAFKKMASSPINVTSVGGWAAMIQHYFVTAWVPDQKSQNQFYTQSSGGSDPTYSAGVAGPDVTIKAGETKTLSAMLFAGPAISSQLSALAPHLDLTVDYGWLWFIGKILFWILSLFHKVVFNWGWSIILLTLLIKIIFWPLSAKSYGSMAKMRILQPQIEVLKKQFGDDKAGFSKAMMGLYQKEKANPLGGCLPMIVQIPVFIALYWVLMESVQLRQAPFIFWIHDLSVKDPYFILPVLMGISMFVQQRMNPPPPDPTQAKIMMFLPVFFTFMFLSFASGLVLYWLVNNCFSVAQQYYVLQKYLKNKARK
jgi:YidC/Oxa1 family membrane protein insertase